MKKSVLRMFATLFITMTIFLFCFIWVGLMSYRDTVQENSDMKVYMGLVDARSRVEEEIFSLKTELIPMAYSKAIASYLDADDSEQFTRKEWAITILKNILQNHPMCSNIYIVMSNGRILTCSNAIMQQEQYLIYRIFQDVQNTYLGNSNISTSVFTDI